ncbi:hypothetical protein EJF36_19475 [Bacillus sp. HMF5848]|uniref:SWIM zinc finger family protein n=1 Tax=Bacillus sp. HMF5848 TaxID=2495421 RepID=UPI000F778F77|nr:hypothetical protein [Bacillus sp. HMF5848]RSK28880.1 hypothetical protein EJF36_19475 [Bacillus sp. HMF5848]
MLRDQLEREQVLQAASDLKNEILTLKHDGQTLMKDGFKLYQQGNVFNVQVIDDTVIGNVMDSSLENPKLYLTDFDRSHCSCFYGGVCPHQVALFFYIFNSVARVGDFIQEVREQQRERQLPSILQQHVKRAREYVDEPVYNEKSIEQWLTYFDEQFEEFMKTQKLSNPFIISQMYHLYYLGLKKHAPTNQEQKRLFVILAGIVVLQKAIDVYTRGEYNDYMRKYHVDTYLANIVESTVNNAVGTPFPKVLKPFIEKIIPIARQLLDRESLPGLRLRMYRELWSNLFTDSSWRQNELEVLKQSSTPLAGKVRAHLHFLLEETAQATTMLAEAEEPLPQLLEWLTALISWEKWDTTKEYVPLLLQHAPAYVTELRTRETKRDATKHILAVLDNYAYTTDDFDVYEHLLRTLFPYSYVETYHYYLYKQRYRDWVELQLLLDYPVEGIDKHDLKTIEKEASELLLPVYHRSVITAIAEKNRKSYKRAVRHMKKLRTLYRKQKQEPTFQTYIERMANEYKRLRALQEEMEHAGLIKKEV